MGYLSKNNTNLPFTRNGAYFGFDNSTLSKRVPSMDGWVLVYSDVGS
jgi:hypothetical protein